MKEKILYITAYVPHKAAAGEKNTMIMLNDLASKYDVDLIYFKYDYDKPYEPERQNVNPIKIIRNSSKVKIWGILNYPFIHPVFSIRFNWALARYINRLVKENNYKTVILNHSNVFLFGKYIDASVPKILFCHDVIAQRVIRSSSWLVQKICIASERFGLKMPNAHVFSFSQKDCDMLKQMYGIDAHLCLDYIDDQIIQKEPKQIGNYYTLFGDWTRKENLDGAKWLINKVITLLKAPIDIKIIGRGFPVELANASGNAKLDVMGFVDDPYQIISDSKAMLTPLFNGAGIKVKVIESLACGTPVIGTDIAFEGLPKGFDQFMILCNDEKSFANAIDSVDMKIAERLKTKNDFIKAYTQDSITNYIDKI